MATETKTAETKAPVTTVRMKFTGPFRGKEKIVQLPIPLIAHSQALDEELRFTRLDERKGPAFCDVPLEWVGSLLAVGGRWQLADKEKMTPELTAKIADAKVACDARMEKFIQENELVEA